MKIKTVVDLANTEGLEGLRRFTAQAIKEIVDLLNGRIGLTDNCQTSLLSVVFLGATTDQGTMHSLGRIPTGYIVTSKTANIQIYNGTTTNTDTTLYLASSGAGTISVLLF